MRAQLSRNDRKDSVFNLFRVVLNRKSDAEALAETPGDPIRSKAGWIPLDRLKRPSPFAEALPGFCAGMCLSWPFAGDPLDLSATAALGLAGYATWLAAALRVRDARRDAILAYFRDGEFPRGLPGLPSFPGESLGRTPDREAYADVASLAAAVYRPSFWGAGMAAALGALFLGAFPAALLFGSGGTPDSAGGIAAGLAMTAAAWLATFRLAVAVRDRVRSANMADAREFEEALEEDRDGHKADARSEPETGETPEASGSANHLKAVHLGLMTVGGATIPALAIAVAEFHEARFIWPCAAVLALVPLGAFAALFNDRLSRATDRLAERLEAARRALRDGERVSRSA